MFERLIDNNEIIKSLKESLEDRTTSPIYGVFIISWMVVHWKFLYTALFVSEDKIWQTEMLLKSDYLSLTFFDFNSLDFYILLILPFFLTWILIWKIPQWVSIKAYEEAQINERKKNEIKLKTKSLLLKGQLEILELTDQNKEKEVKIIQKEEEINKIDPTAEWSKEFKEIVTKNGHLISAIEFGKKIVYRTQGRFATLASDAQNGYRTYITPDSLAILDTFNLITFTSKERDIIDFTEKGKFFVQKLSTHSTS
ncbi:TPA: hypothetical protein DEP58_03230 [Patescibacteria group bacterium]|nr:MAG: hypothetical protein UU98_C0028G0011 [Parcubacteria group bacterium GW2011_GWD2_42_14]HCC05293.1 hypothetical protein [Patescibacteria group bacterium]